ncbi:MAG: PepSY-associated TM helix domain-containing protein [Candidatus Methylophosphatis roskildensis]
MSRRVWVKVHRYAGLYMALFLTVAGLTGCLLAFLAELEGALNPQYRVDESNAAVFDPLSLREKLLQRLPQARVDNLPLHRQPGEALHLWIEMPAAEGSGEMVTTALVLDPYTDAEISRRNTDIWPLTRKNLMAFVYRLHYSLALGEPGLWLFGIAAMVWTLDCFVGAYLTLPVRIHPREDARTLTPPRAWLRRWSRAWTVNWRGSAWRVNFDLHRASGLWVWAMLFVFAWSGVAFNLGDQVYRPVMRLAFGMTDPIGELPLRPQPASAPSMAWPAAHRVGRVLMAEQARARGFTLVREQMLSHDSERGIYRYAVLSSRDVNEKWGSTTVAFDAATGAFLALNLPTGQDVGTTITQWLLALHTAHLWGWPMQVFVCAMGLIVATLSITGSILWLKRVFLSN